MKKQKIILCTEVLILYYELVSNRNNSEQEFNLESSFYEILYSGSNTINEINKLLEILNKIAGYKLVQINDEIKLLKVISRVVHFDYSNIQYILSNKETYYSEFTIKKKSGGIRKINAPNSWLKSLLKDITTLLYLLRVPNNNSFGFELQRNIVDNAKLHVVKRVVLNIDLKDFFPTITKAQVKGVFMNEPFKLNNNLAELLADLTTYKDKLPQGASTSPIISNYVCANLDIQLSDFCKKENITYSRYADDLTFSHSYNISEKQQDLIVNIIHSNRFIINSRKLRKQLPHQRQCVTGITINEKLNIRRKYINEVRAILDNWKKHGYINALERYLEIHHIGIEKSISLFRILSGKINYIGMVRGKNDWIFLKLKNQLNELKMN